MSHRPGILVDSSQCRDEWFRGWSHVLYKCVVAHVSESRHTDRGFWNWWMALRVVINGFVERVLSYIDMLRHTWTSHVTQIGDFGVGGWLSVSWWMVSWSSCRSLHACPWLVSPWLASFLMTATRCNTLQHVATHMTCLVLARQLSDDCNTLQHAATHCDTSQYTRLVSPWLASFLMTATHFNTLQHTATHRNTHDSSRPGSPAFWWLQHTSTHCNTLQHTATHCNTLQHTPTYCNTLQHTATHCHTRDSPDFWWMLYTTAHCSTQQHTLLISPWLVSFVRTVTHYSTLQHNATHGNTLQHTWLASFLISLFIPWLTHMCIVWLIHT